MFPPKKIISRPFLAFQNIESIQSFINKFLIIRFFYKGETSSKIYFNHLQAFF